MADMLVVSTSQLRNPVSLFVAVIADDRLLDDTVWFRHQGTLSIARKMDRTDSTKTSIPKSHVPSILAVCGLAPDFTKRTRPNLQTTNPTPSSQPFAFAPLRSSNNILVGSFAEMLCGSFAAI